MIKRLVIAFVLVLVIATPVFLIVVKGYSLDQLIRLLPIPSVNLDGFGQKSQGQDAQQAQGSSPTQNPPDKVGATIQDAANKYQDLKALGGKIAYEVNQLPVAAPLHQLGATRVPFIDWLLQDLATFLTIAGVFIKFFGQRVWGIFSPILQHPVTMLQTTLQDIRTQPVLSLVRLGGVGILGSLFLTKWSQGPLTASYYLVIGPIIIWFVETLLMSIIAIFIKKTVSVIVMLMVLALAIVVIPYMATNVGTSFAQFTQFITDLAQTVFKIFAGDTSLVQSMLGAVLLIWDSRIADRLKRTVPARAPV